MNNRENSFYIIVEHKCHWESIFWAGEPIWGTKVPQDPSFYYFILFIATAFPFIILYFL
jgi:hypothetical protein